MVAPVRAALAFGALVVVLALAVFLTSGSVLPPAQEEGWRFEHRAEPEGESLLGRSDGFDAEREWTLPVGAMPRVGGDYRGALPSGRVTLEFEGAAPPNVFAEFHSQGTAVGARCDPSKPEEQQESALGQLVVQPTASGCRVVLEPRVALDGGDQPTVVWEMTLGPPAGSEETVARFSARSE